MNAPDGPCQSAGSGAETTQCFFKASQKADGDLNQIYAQIRTILDPEDFQKLQAAQRLWLQFRDANCIAERDLYTGGSAAPMVYLACMEADTKQRVTELKTMYGWRIEKFKPN
jgi:uncharacterized protein YecT (DUF1311 family)